MDVKTQKIDKDKIEITIEVPASDLEQAIISACRQISGEVKIPGFRQGKAPRNVLETRYGKDVIVEQAYEGLAGKLFSKAVREQEIRVYGEPQFEAVQLVEGQPLIFKAVTTVWPKVELGDYKALPAIYSIVEVTDADIDARIEDLRRSRSKLVSIDSPIQQGDYAMIDFEGFVDGETFEGGSAESYMLEIGSGNFIPGFEDKLINAAKDQSLEVEVDFPADYHAEQFAGKPAMFKVLVKDVRRRELPELDDEFVKDSSKFATVEELKNDIRQTLTEEAEARAKREFRETVIDKAITNAIIELPEIMVTEHLENMVAQMTRRFEQQGMNMEEYLKYRGETNEQLRDTMRPAADKDLRRDLVLAEIAKQEKISVSDEQFGNEINRMAQMYKLTPEKLLKQLKKSDDIMSIHYDLMLKNAAELIVDTAVRTADAD